MSYYGKKGFVYVFQFPNCFLEGMQRCNCFPARTSFLNTSYLFQSNYCNSRFAYIRNPKNIPRTCPLRRPTTLDRPRFSSSFLPDVFLTSSGRTGRADIILSRVGPAPGILHLQSPQGRRPTPPRAKGPELTNLHRDVTNSKSPPIVGGEVSKNTLNVSDQLQPLHA